MDTLAVQLTLPTTKRVVDFHHQVVAHAGRTSISRDRRKNGGPFVHRLLLTQRQNISLLWMHERFTSV